MTKMAKKTQLRARMRSLPPALAISLLAISVGHAESCPADLTALRTQIQAPELQARLSMPAATLIANAGGIDQAIANTSATLASVQARRAIAAASGRDTKSLDDAILIFTRQIEVFQCLKG